MIELSADLGEGAPDEPAIWPLIDAANVACGGHVGDEASMREAAALAAGYGVVLGAHPSYPDRENFGRKSMKIDSAELRESLAQQIASLAAIAPVSRVKAHGALYNDAHHDRELAEVILDAMPVPMAIVASSTSQMAIAARARGVRVIREAFADRGYRADGSLIPRGQPGALLSVNEAAGQVKRLLQGDLAIEFDTICIHADMEQAAERLRAVRLVVAAL